MTPSSQLRIRHTVVFKLWHTKGSPEEREFLEATRQLSAIPGVERFETLAQISSKNPFNWGLSMEFATMEIYEQYNRHPEHVRFVEQRWLKEVKEFMEIDYQLVP